MLKQTCVVSTDSFPWLLFGFAVCPWFTLTVFVPKRHQRWARFLRFRVSNHFTLDVLHYLQKCLLHIIPSHRRRLVKNHPVAFGKLSAFLRVYLLMVLLIWLGWNKHFLNTLSCMLLYLWEPILNILKCLLVGWIIGKDDALCSLVIRLSDGPKAFLTSRVPNLHFHNLAVQVNCLNFEIDS